MSTPFPILLFNCSETSNAVHKSFISNILQDLHATLFLTPLHNLLCSLIRKGKPLQPIDPLVVPIKPNPNFYESVAR